MMVEIPSLFRVSGDGGKWKTCETLRIQSVKKMETTCTCTQFVFAIQITMTSLYLDFHKHYKWQGNVELELYDTHSSTLFWKTSSSLQYFQMTIMIHCLHKANFLATLSRQLSFYWVTFCYRNFNPQLRELKGILDFLAEINCIVNKIWDFLQELTTLTLILDKLFKRPMNSWYFPSHTLDPACWHNLYEALSIERSYKSDNSNYITDWHRTQPLWDTLGFKLSSITEMFWLFSTNCLFSKKILSHFKKKTMLFL